MNNREREQKLYEDLYKSDDAYGRRTHGKGACIFTVKQFKPESILDVGCGRDNEFCGEILYELERFQISHNITKLTGCDFVKFPNSMQADANNLPFKDKEFDVITSFDMLEHILPEDVDNVLKEFDRVSKKGMIFSIAYHQVKRGLHKTIQPEEWWMEKLSKYGKVDKFYKYIYVQK